MKNCYLVPLLGLLGWHGLTPACYGQRAALADCLHTFSSDSIALYFDQHYKLAPPECAVIKRVGRVDTAGSFQGEVVDYRTADNSRLAQFHYEAGQPTGPAMLYFTSGHLAAQGSMQKGRQSGEWHYWYRSGQPRQVLRFLPEGPARILAYWDSTGRQLVRNGSGHWQGLAATGLLMDGEVRQGLLSGTWRGLHPRSRLLVTTELYDRGSFRRGRLAQPPADQPAVYQFAPRLVPLEPAPFLQANALQVGYTCVESRRQAQFQLIKAEFQVPSVAMGTERYAGRLTQRLLRYRSSRWYEMLPPQATVRCVLDQGGKFVGFESDIPALREVVRTLVVRAMPAWQSARYQNAPVPGYLDITLNTLTYIVVVKPAARLHPSQLPEPRLLAWP